MTVLVPSWHDLAHGVLDDSKKDVDPSALEMLRTFALAAAKQQVPTAHEIAVQVNRGLCISWPAVQVHLPPNMNVWVSVGSEVLYPRQESDWVAALVRIVKAAHGGAN